MRCVAVLFTLVDVHFLIVFDGIFLCRILNSYVEIDFCTK